METEIFKDSGAGTLHSMYLELSVTNRVICQITARGRRPEARAG